MGGVTFRRDKQQCLIIDVVVPDRCMNMKERENDDRYRDLRIEIAKMWHLRESNVKIILILIGTLGSKPPDLKN